VWGSALLAISLVMIRAAFTMRIPRVGGGYSNAPLGIMLIVAGTAMFGTSVVLVLKSPFRMPPGERLFRAVWLGPIGRAFVRFAGHGVRNASSRPMRVRVVAVPAIAGRAMQPQNAAPVDVPVEQTRTLAERVSDLERWRAQFPS
jgi:hypothetical protein